MKKNQQRRILAAVIIAATFFSSTAIAQWVTKVPVPGTGRWAAQSFVLDGNIYVGGGYIGNFVNLNDFQAYDTATGKWTAKGIMPGTTTMRTAGIAFVADGKAYLGLGASDYNNFSPSPTYLKDLWEYDAAANTWSQKANIPGKGRADATVFVVNKKAYIVGGTTENAASGAQTDEVWEYNPATDKWTAKAALPTGDIYKASGFNIGTKGYIMGGEITSGSAPVYSDKLYEYNATTDKWTAKAALPATASARSGGVAFVVKEKAYYGAGQQSVGSAATFYSDFFLYDPNVDMWNNMTGFTGNGRAFGMALSLGNTAYVGGGWSRVGGSQTFYNEFFEVDPATLSVGTIKSGISINTYPNPAKDILYITSEQMGKNATYNIYTMLGQSILSGQINNTNSINVSTLPTGQYMLETVSDTGYGKILISVVK